MQSNPGPMKINSSLSIIMPVFLLFVSCEHFYETENDYPRGISYFQIYASDQKALVEWHTWSGYIDFDLYAPPVKTTRLSMSTTNESSGFKEIYTGSLEGTDSFTISGLTNNIPYYFILETYGFDGQKIGTSRPVCTIPGRLPEEVLSYKVSDPNEYNNYTNISWSPDGGELAFIDFNSSGYKNIYILDKNTLSVKVVTNHQAEYLGGVSWSPDGSALAYVQSPSTTVAYLDYRIWLLDLVTLNTRPVSSGPVDSDPDWLSDTQIIHTKGTIGPPNIPELTLLDLVDGSETALTDDGVLYKYSPDVDSKTGKILYTAHKSRDNSSCIYVTVPNSGEGDLLIDDGRWDMSNPVWSPDGSKIYFTSDRTGHNEIWSMRIKDKVFDQVTRGGNIGSSRSLAAINNSGTLLAYIQKEADNSEFLKVLSLE